MRTPAGRLVHAFARGTRPPGTSLGEANKAWPHGGGIFSYTYPAGYVSGPRRRSRDPPVFFAILACRAARKAPGERTSRSLFLLLEPGRHGPAPGDPAFPARSRRPPCRRT